MGRGRALWARLLLMGVLALVVAGCEVDATLDVRVREDGSGIVKLTVVADAGAVKAVESGGAKLEQAVRLDDLTDSGWDLGAWERRDDGSASVVVSKRFVNVDEVRGIVEEINGEHGPLRDMRASRDVALLSTEYAVRGRVDFEVLDTGVQADSELVESLAAQGVDVAAIDAQLLAQVASSFAVMVVVHLPDHAPVRVAPESGKVTRIDATSSVRDTEKMTFLAAAVGFGALAVVVWVRGGRSRRRRRRRRGSGRGPARGPASGRPPARAVASTGGGPPQPPPRRRPSGPPTPGRSPHRPGPPR